VNQLVISDTSIFLFFLRTEFAFHISYVSEYTPYMCKLRRYMCKWRDAVCTAYSRESYNNYELRVVCFNWKKMQNAQLVWRNVKSHACGYRSHVSGSFCEIYTLGILRYTKVYMRFVGHEGCRV